jgi:hypothetical protein
MVTQAAGDVCIFNRAYVAGIVIDTLSDAPFAIEAVVTDVVALATGLTAAAQVRPAVQAAQAVKT